MRESRGEEYGGRARRRRGENEGKNEEKNERKERNMRGRRGEE